VLSAAVLDLDEVVGADKTTWRIAFSARSAIGFEATGIREKEVA
jgi:hypothetical protein